MYKRKFYRRKPFKKRFYKKKSVNGKINKLFQIVKRNSPEFKYTEKEPVTTTNFTNTTGAVYNLLNELEQGTKRINNIIGNKMMIRTANIRLELTVNTSSTTISKVRCMLVSYSGLNYDESAPVISGSEKKLLENTTISSQRFQDNKKLYKVWYDKVYTLDNQTSTSKMLTIYKKLFIKTEYETDWVKTNHPNKGGLYLIVFGDQTTNIPSANCSYRIYYTDA